MSNESLERELARLQLELPDDHVGRLSDYASQLWDHNSRLNLTRHTDFRTFAQRDVLDSVKLSSLLQPSEAVIDFGSGGGVPGLLITILRPDLKVTLVECVTKKVRVLEQMVSALDLPVEVVDDRIEKVLGERDCDTLTARAVGPLQKMLPWFRGKWDAFGRMLLVKGPRWTEERKDAEQKGLLEEVSLACVLSYPMPGRDSESVVLELRR